jgi:hypothetical protein
METMSPELQYAVRQYLRVAIPCLVLMAIGASYVFYRLFFSDPLVVDLPLLIGLGVVCAAALTTLRPSILLVSAGIFRQRPR